ncbi:glucooligosaccharide oxidase [Echria macrotheca]|uniref:Glucooligosaccharide oxidase n=1 Tax=Echria macrotheca TaxID=438768 RepID=A0AAJ0F5N0_9PEZI|nr:glucooligosaccharide oxidase [Echria macrotheca]
MRLQQALPIGLAAVAAANPLGKRAAIDDCLKAANVPVDTPNSSEWKNDVNPFNQRLPYTPVAIAVPTTTDHIAAAVSCAVKVGVKVNPKSGGHSYASFGLGGENGHLVVELDRMNKVTVDSSTQIATVQAGARLGHVATVLYNNGKRAFSHGTCPGVGVGGHSLHGGFGFSSHTHGLAVDWIVGATVVLANGTVVDTSETQHPDLFWALRGAGSNFGIVSTFKFKTFAAPSTVTAYQVNLPWNSASSIASGWGALQDWLSSGGMPAEMNMRVFGSGSQTQLQGLYHGSSGDLRSAIQPLLSKLSASLSNSQQYDWMGAFTYYTYGGTVDVTHPYSSVETFYSKSLVTTALPSKALNAVSQYWASQARSNSRNWFIIIDLYGGKTSAVTKQAVNSSAFAYRDPSYLFLYELYDRVNYGSYPSNGFSFLDGWVKSFTDNLSTSQWGMYINYADPTMNRTYAQQVYYRQSLPRLQQLKAELDPNEVFYYPQAITPAK